MNQGETRFWKFLGPKLKKYGHFDRIESHETAIGTPDINYCINGYTNNLELKFTNSEKRGLKLRPSQCGWFKRRVAAGGQPWLLAHLDIRGLKGYVLIAGDAVPALAHTTRVNDWLHAGVVVWQKEIPVPRLVEFLSFYMMMDPVISNGSGKEEPSRLILPPSALKIVS